MRAIGDCTGHTPASKSTLNVTGAMYGAWYRPRPMVLMPGLGARRGKPLARCWSLSGVPISLVPPLAAYTGTSIARPILALVFVSDVHDIESAPDAVTYFAEPMWTCVLPVLVPLTLASAS